MDPETTEEKIEKLAAKIDGHGELDGTYKLDSWIPDDDYAVKVGYSSTVDSLDPSFNITYGDLGSVGTLDMFEEELKKKYPALRQAYEHYKNIKQMCETREQEENDS